MWVLYHWAAREASLYTECVSLSFVSCLLNSQGSPTPSSLVSASFSRAVLFCHTIGHSWTPLAPCLCLLAFFSAGYIPAYLPILFTFPSSPRQSRSQRFCLPCYSPSHPCGSDLPLLHSCFPNTHPCDWSPTVSSLNVYICAPWAPVWAPQLFLMVPPGQRWGFNTGLSGMVAFHSDRSDHSLLSNLNDKQLEREALGKLICTVTSIQCQALASSVGRILRCQRLSQDRGTFSDQCFLISASVCNLTTHPFFHSFLLLCHLWFLFLKLDTSVDVD